MSTVTLAVGMLKASASSPATTWTAWVLAQTVSLSGPSHLAVSPWGSRQTWVMTGRLYVPSITTSALRHRLVGLALGLRPALADVAPLEDLGRPLGHGLGLGDDVGQDLVLDLDGADGVAGLLLGLGRHRGDVVALVAEGRPRLGDRGHRLHARHLLGRRRCRST